MHKNGATIFHFKKYVFNLKKLEINFYYQVDFSNKKKINLKETIVLPSVPKKYSRNSVKKFLESLHIILGISYYKIYCPPKINTPYKFSKEEANFWNIVYKKGLGELLYKNNLNPKILAKFSYSKKSTTNQIRLNQKDRALLGIGGGKDSIVSMEILKDYPVLPFNVETEKTDFISHNVVKKNGKKIFTIKRYLDKKVFKLNENSYNGHIPISAIFAFIGFLAGYLYDYKYVIVGNEKSSNFGNIDYFGETINHQWSKSEEFENLIQEYTRKFITPDIIYFSILRRFYEIEIARMFSSYKKYFYTFSSCNRNFRVNKERENNLWCKECPKCLFTFLILSPFIDKKELINIFGENLFSKKELLPLFGEILGFKGKKPFDCVGTFEEARASLVLASNKFKNDIVIKEYLSKINLKKEEIEKLFKNNFTDLTPSFFNLYGIKNVAIIGYGREGKVAEKYIKKNHPDLKIAILDESIDKNYLEKQNNYDFAIKTSGIPKRKIKIPYTTGTNIFFSKNRNFVIGITGTKGKSTTSTLVYQILKEDKRKVRLIGNIGKPMLEVFLKKINEEEIFVIELSSYMLDDIKYSPNVAVLLSLFPEHMDYHNGLENYYSAKKNIFKFQSKGDIALKFPFKENINFLEKKSLYGMHNINNIKASIKIAKLLNVKEKIIKNTIENFKPLNHRMEFIGNFNGIYFYNDASGTTPESTISAIKSLKNIDTIFLGGEDRGYDFSELEKNIKKYKIRNLILFPDSGEKMLSSYKGFNIFKTRSMKEAVEFSFKNTKKGKICLLSTASPSYSLWKNFEEKGNLFKEEVKKYKKNGK